MRLIDADVAQGIADEELFYDEAEAVRFVLSHTPTIETEPVRSGRWEWFEEWLPSTPEHPSECEDCGWRCGNCKQTLEDMVGGYWDDEYETPKLNYCPNCGAKTELED